MKNTKHLALFITLFLLIFGGVYMFTTTNSKTDNYKSVKDSIVYVHDTVWVDFDDKKVEKPSKPIPAITKFKATDWVCAWSKWSGVVREISWSTRVPNTLVYTVQHYNEEDGWYENEYVDTELEAGKCY
jgi:hypothetical protein